MNIKRILAGVLACCVIGGTLLYADGKTADNAVITATAAQEGALSYINYGSFVWIIGCDKSATEVVIPAKIEGVPVGCISSTAFRSCTELESIEIPDSVTNIGEAAFCGCKKLKKINIPNGITNIEDFTFQDCLSLTSVTIPDSVTSISNGAFQGCTGLTSVTLPEGLTSIGNKAFYNCKNMKKCRIPDGVTNIADGAFYNCESLTEINIPDGMTSIGTSVFCGCKGLTEITITNKITSIGDYAFSKCTGLTSVTIPKSVTSIGEGAFFLCENLVSVTLPDSIEWVGGKSFHNTPWLKEKQKENPFVVINGCLIDAAACSGDVVIPDYVKSIEYGAFEDCQNLKSVTIPKSVTSIGNHAFAYQTLTSITIPDSITTIKEGAFRQCTKMTSVTIPDSVTKIEEGAFSGTAWLQSKKKENPLVIAGKAVIDGENCSGDVVIPDGITMIADCAFKECTGLTSIKIPGSVKSIGNSAFYNCTEMTSLDLSDGVTTIEDSAFYCCKSLKSIEIPESVTSIGENAFIGCPNVTSISIPGNVTSISKNSFSSYNYLESLTLGNIDILLDRILEVKDIFMINYPRLKLNYKIKESEADKSNFAKNISVESKIDYTTISDTTSFLPWPYVDKLQECKDSKGNVYAIVGNKDSITLVSENTSIKPVTIENEGFTFGAALIDEDDYLYVFWGYSVRNINDVDEEETENLVMMKYDLKGNVIGRCGITLAKSGAQYPFDGGNASMALKDNGIGCFFDTEWTNGHQGSEIAYIDKNNMELINLWTNEGSHSFGVSLIATDYGFAGIQKKDGADRGINLNKYLVSDNKLDLGFRYTNGSKRLFNASGQYETDKNHTYVYIGGLAKSATTYAVAGQSERVYLSKEHFGSSDLRTYNFDVFLKISDQSFAKTAPDLAGEERVDVKTGETANYNIIWLTECNETEQIGLIKVVTLADGSYCVLWEKFINDKFDSIRYVITDECGNILRHETGIYGARLSDTSVQPIVEGYTLKWAVADKESQCVNFYTVNLNDFSTANIRGDVNCDGKVNTADAVLLQKWLLAVPDTKLPNWKAADLCADDKLDAFDMIEMRKLLIQNK